MCQGENHRAKSTVTRKKVKGENCLEFKSQNLNGVESVQSVLLVEFVALVLLVNLVTKVKSLQSNIQMQKKNQKSEFRNVKAPSLPYSKAP